MNLNDTDGVTACQWTHDEDNGVWQTSCGEAHLFEEGGPAENAHRWCCYCGKPLSTAGVGEVSRG